MSLAYNMIGEFKSTLLKTMGRKKGVVREEDIKEYEEEDEEVQPRQKRRRTKKVGEEEEEDVDFREVFVEKEASDSIEDRLGKLEDALQRMENMMKTFTGIYIFFYKHH